MKQTSRLREIMNGGKTAVALGAHDALSARLIEKVGFDAVYVGSYATEASFMAKPDVMSMGKAERLWIARNMTKAVNIPVIVDAEEGFGNAVNVIDAVQDFEAAGIAGIHLDDERIPSKCPFIQGIAHPQLVSTDEMCGKIEAAVEARQDPDFLIIARSDVIGTVPLDQYCKDNLIEEVIQRSNAYAAAGADAIFVMALSKDEIDYFAQEIKAPLVGIFSDLEPHPIAAFQNAGYKITIGSIVTLYSAIKGVAAALCRLKQTGDWNKVKDLMIDDDEFFDLIGIERYRHWFTKFRVP